MIGLFTSIWTVNDPLECAFRFLTITYSHFLEMKSFGLDKCLKIDFSISDLCTSHPLFSNIHIKLEKQYLLLCISSTKKANRVNQQSTYMKSLLYYLYWKSIWKWMKLQLVMNWIYFITCRKVNSSHIEFKTNLFPVAHEWNFGSVFRHFDFTM